MKQNFSTFHLHTERFSVFNICDPMEVLLISFALIFVVFIRLEFLVEDMSHNKFQNYCRKFLKLTLALELSLYQRNNEI